MSWAIALQTAGYLFNFFMKRAEKKEQNRLKIVDVLKRVNSAIPSSVSDTEEYRKMKEDLIKNGV